MKLPVVEVHESQHSKAISEVIALLEPFAKDKETQMAATYIITQLTRKSITTEELADLENKLGKWLKHDIAKSKVGGRSFGLVLERALVEVQNSMLLSEPLIQIESQGNKIKTISLNELLTLLKEKEFLETLPSLTLRFGRGVTESQLQFLIDCLIAYPISFPVDLNFSECQLGAEGSKLLSEYLKSGKTAQNLVLWLYDCGINDEGAGYLAEGIKSGQTSENLTLNLEGNRISAAGIKLLSDAIQSGSAKNKLNLTLENQANSEAAAKHLAELICNPKTSNGLILALCSLDDNVVQILADALHVGKSKNLDFDIRKISPNARLCLMNSIAQSSPEGLSLHMSVPTNELDGPLGAALNRMIAEGRAPKNMRCSIGTFGEAAKDSQFINLLSEALAEGKAPFGLCLSFSWSKIPCSEEAKLRLLSVLESKKLPAHFRLDNVGFLLVDDLPFQKALAALLMKNTSFSVTYEASRRLLNEGEDHTFLDIIRHCSQRNQLLWRYPQHADLIKKISSEAGYYNPEKERISPPKLTSYAAQAFFDSKNKIEDYDEVLQSLPKPVVDYIQSLETITDQIKKDLFKP